MQTPSSPKVAKAWFVLLVCALLPFFWALGFLYPRGDDFDYATRAMFLLDVPGGIFESVREWLFQSGRYTYHFLAVLLGKAGVWPLLAALVCAAVLAAPAQARVSLSYINGPGSAAAVSSAQGALNQVSPAWLELNPDGSLRLTGASRSFVEEMHRQDMAVLPFLSNHWDRTLGQAALDNREALTDQLAQLVRDYDLDGISLDLENMTKEHDDEYTDLVRLLRQKHHITRTDLGRACGLSPQRISEIELSVQRLTPVTEELVVSVPIFTVPDMATVGEHWSRYALLRVGPGPGGTAGLGCGLLWPYLGHGQCGCPGCGHPGGTAVPADGTVRHRYGLR